MKNCIVIYTSDQSCPPGTSGELLDCLRQAVEDRGDVVVGTFTDHGAEGRRKRKAGWKTLLASLDGVDQIAVASAGDLPGRSLPDLLRLLATLRDHGVGLLLLHEGIDTDSGSAAILDLIAAHRAVRVSRAIKAGQARALAAGKITGRPAIPHAVLVRIQACLRAGHGIRPTAKRFNVSPGSVINARRSMQISLNKQAA